MNQQQIQEMSNDPTFQVNRWKHSADWWSGRILPHVVDKAKAAEAVEMVEFWAERMLVG